MSEYIITIPKWWNHKGYTAHAPDEKSPGHLTYTTESGHLKIRPGPSRDYFHLRSIIFKSSIERIDVEAILSTSELETMFDIVPRVKNETDPEYAERFGGDFGLPGKFFRKENFVNFTSPGTGMDGDPNFSFHLQRFMQKDVDFLIKNFRVP